MRVSFPCPKCGEPVKWAYPLAVRAYRYVRFVHAGAGSHYVPVGAVVRVKTRFGPERDGVVVAATKSAILLDEGDARYLVPLASIDRMSVVSREEADYFARVHIPMRRHKRERSLPGYGVR